MSSSIEQIIRDYLHAIENREDVLRFYTEDATQTEFPNKFVPDGATRNLEQIREANDRGKQVMQRQKYDVHNIIADGDRVCVEFTWTGWIAIAIGTLAPGDAMTGRFCMVMDMENGRIKRQRNYDCFDPF